MTKHIVAYSGGHSSALVAVEAEQNERLLWKFTAETTLRTGIMQLVRAVALPKGF
jgi:PP-loop superfamily ATP-utilizing enzyme